MYPHPSPLTRRAFLVHSKKNAMKIPIKHPITKLNETINFIFGLNGFKGGSVSHAKETSGFSSIFSIIMVK